MITAITYGSFDLLHEGHLTLLRNAKKHCDRIIIFLSTDEFQLVKGKPLMREDYATRRDKLLSSGLVEGILPENSWEQKVTDIELITPDFLFMGSDWEGSFENLGIPTKFFPYTEGISSTQLRRTPA